VSRWSKAWPFLIFVGGAALAPITRDFFFPSIGRLSAATQWTLAAVAAVCLLAGLAALFAARGNDAK
jgi:hypothetical protein